jgi:uncharacterized protein (DUF2164 family)
MKLKEQIIEEYSKLSDEQLAQLSEEERQELVSILESPDEEWAPEQNYAPTLSEMEEAKSQVEPTTGEALSAGWVEGIPFLKDAVSAYDGIAETIEDGGSFEDGYARYEEKLDDINKDLNRVEEQSPWTMAAGEIGGTAATMVAGGALLKGAGAGATLTTKGISAASAVGTGALSQLSRSEDRGVDDVIVGAGLGAAGEVGAHYITKGAKKAGAYLMDKAGDVYSSATKRILGMETASASRQFRKYLKQNNMKESEFLNSVLTRKMADSDELVLSLAKDTPERMVDKTEVYLNQTGQKLGKLYQQVDDKFDVKVDVDELKNSLIDDVVEPMMKSDDPDMQDIGLGLSKYIQRIGTKVKSAKKEVTPEGTKLIEDLTVDPDWNLQRIHRLQVTIRKRLESLFKQKNIAVDSSKEQHRKVAASLGKHMDEILDSVSTESDDVLSEVMKTRKDFSSMALLKDTMEDAIHRKKDDPIQALKDAISFKSLLAGGVAAKYVGPAGLMVGPVFSRMMNDPKTPLYLSKGMETVAKTIQAVPGGRVASRLNAAALMSNDRFEKELYGIVAENNLKANRIPRNTQSIRDHVEDIRHYLKAEDREMLRNFDIALESGNEDALGSFLDGVSKAPGANKFFEEGVGFNGKVYTQDDKQMFERQLKMTDMPATQRMEMLENLRSGGTIPDFNNIRQAQPQQHQPRTKKLKDY